MTQEQPQAGRGRRLVATLIDFFLVPTLAILIMLVTGVLEHAEDFSGSQPLIRALLLGLSSYLVLNGWLLWRRGQTVGKAIMKLAIVSNDTGEKLPLWRLLCIRALFFPVLYGDVIATYFGLLMLLDQGLIFRKNRRCLHDLVSGSRVVRVAQDRA